MRRNLTEFQLWDAHTCQRPGPFDAAGSRAITAQFVAAAEIN
jgi:hypothetical protein